MNPAVTYFQINRLRAAAERHDIRYAQVENDVNALLVELDRVRRDNEHLRATHAQIWRLANTPPDKRIGEWLIGLSALLIVLSTIAIAIGLRGGR